MHFRKNILFLVLLLGLTSISLAIVQVAPPVTEISVHRGYSGEFELKIINLGDSETPVQFSVHNMDVTDEGTPFTADSTFRMGCGDWITLERDEVMMKPHSTIIMNNTLTVPKNAEGSYYALIKATFKGVTFELESEKGKFIEGSGIQLDNQVIVLVMLTVPSSRNRAELLPDTILFYPKGIPSDTTADSEENMFDQLNSGWELVMPFRNEGNVHDRLFGQVSLWSESGSRIGSAELKAGKGYILPGRKRNFSAKGDKILSDGYYMLRISLQTGSKKMMSQSFSFAVYQGDVYPGATSEGIDELIRASSPGFALKEPLIQKSVAPGVSTYLVIPLRNTLRDTLRLYPKFIDWSITPQGELKYIHNSKESERSCTNWMEFMEESIEIPPGRSKPFKIRVAVPDTMTGEYYSAVIFYPDSVKKDLSPEFLLNRTQFLALKSSREFDYKFAIDSIEVKKGQDGEYTIYDFIFKVRNIGNIHGFAEGKLMLEREEAPGRFELAGYTVDFGSIDMNILPGGERDIIVRHPELEPGKYRIIVSVNYAHDNEQPVIRYQLVNIN